MNDRLLNLVVLVQILSERIQKVRALSVFSEVKQTSCKVEGVLKVARFFEEDFSKRLAAL